MTLAGSTSKVVIGQPKGPQEPPLRSLCGPACREQPGTGENSRRQATAFTRVFPRVPGCARSPNVSGRQDLNLRPPGPQPGALPDCATPRDPPDSTGNALARAQAPVVPPACEHPFAPAHSAETGRSSPRSRPRRTQARQHREGHRRPRLATAARRAPHARPRLCKLSSSTNRPPGRLRACGGSSTVEPRPSKAMMRVRFPSAASGARRPEPSSASARPSVSRPGASEPSASRPAGPSRTKPPRPSPTAAPPWAPPPTHPPAPAAATAHTSCRGRRPA
jgi:hypothetical protein